MPNTLEKAAVKLAGKVRNQFLIGLVISVPLFITIWVFIWVFNTIDNILQPIVRLVTGKQIIGVGFVATIILVYLTGLVSTNVVGKRLIEFGDSLLKRVPFVRALYTSVKDVVGRLSEPGKNNILQVAMVEYPRKGTMSLAFITSECTGRAGEKLITLLVPTAPNPMSGYVITVGEKEITRTGIKIDTAMKMVMSCGALVSPEITDKLLNNQSTVDRRS